MAPCWERDPSKKQPRDMWVTVFAMLVEEEEEDKGAARVCMDGDISQVRLQCANCGPAL